jgi:myo-inositol-1(or 4)-monophosphatase
MPFEASKLQDYARFAGALADAAREETLPRFRADAAVASKRVDAFDPVTEADRAAERRIRSLIAEAFPDHGVLGEEYGEERAGAPWRWVIDPIDGTRGFMCGTATWATLIALEFEGQPTLGLIDQPFTDERWIGFGGVTVYRRAGAERVCRTSEATALRAARVATTDPRAGAYFSETEAGAFARLALAGRVARFSLDAYAYGLLAIGQIDLVAESGLKRHDFAALSPIIAGAGGVIGCWRGRAPGEDDRGRILAASSPALFEAAQEILAGA